MTEEKHIAYAYNVEADLEGFTEAELDFLEFVPEELEELRAEFTESMDLENIDPEKIAESLAVSMERREGSGRHLASSGSHLSEVANKRTLMTFIVMLKRAVRRIMVNPITRKKLEEAVRKGPTAVSRLIVPLMTRQVPPQLRFLPEMYVPEVVHALADPIRKEVGVKAEEVEEAPEFLQFVITAATVAASVASVAPTAPAKTPPSLRMSALGFTRRIKSRNRRNKRTRK